MPAAMVQQLPEILLWGFLYFCRIGGLLMVFPGFSSARVPMFVRLMLAVGITMALAPLLLHAPGAAPPADARLTLDVLLGLAFQETLKGVAMGLMARMFFLALEFLATGMTQFIGLGNFPGMPAEGQEPVPALVSLIMLSATALVFVSGLHGQAIAAVVDSYATLPVGTWLMPADALDGIVSRLARGTYLALQATAPFVVYGVIVNLAIGLVNRMVPQIPAYFISLPLIILGGLFLLFFMAGDMLGVFMAGFADWLEGE